MNVDHVDLTDLVVVNILILRASTGHDANDLAFALGDEDVPPEVGDAFSPPLCEILYREIIQRAVRNKPAIGSPPRLNDDLGYLFRVR